MSELGDTLEKKLAEVQSHFAELKDTVDHLPQVARHEFEKRLHEVEVIVHAFDRDVKEIDQKRGADPAKVLQLSAVLTEKIDKLEHDVDFLAMGNPSTVVAAGDKAMESFGKLAKKFRNVLREFRDRLHSQD